jgi:GntP family gluconate:H+ symporter
MATRTGRNYLLYVLAIAVGTTMTHSLVPPTPGPLFVANALNVDLGAMIIAGLLLSAFAASFGLAYAWWANRRWPIAPRSPSDDAAPAPAVERPDNELPPLWLALAPIILPVLLISGATLVNVVAVDPEFSRVIKGIGHPNIALSIAAAIALLTVATRRGADRTTIRNTVQTALADAGTIILITAAGGVFGGVLQETGVGERIQGLARAYQIGMLPLAFLVTALIRVAQGSATVAMVTSVGILSAVASSTSLGFHPVYLALAIGCGSKMMPWMNDSGFWVVCKTSGLTEREMLRSLSVMFSIMSVVGFAVVTIAAAIFPLV